MSLGEDSSTGSCKGHDYGTGEGRGGGVGLEGCMFLGGCNGLELSQLAYTIIRWSSHYSNGGCANFC